MTWRDRFRTMRMDVSPLRDFWSYDERTDPHATAERERRRAAGEAVG